MSQFGKRGEPTQPETLLAQARLEMLVADVRASQGYTPAERLRIAMLGLLLFGMCAEPAWKFFTGLLG